MIGTFSYTGIGYELDEEAAWDYIRNGYLLGPRTVLKGRTKILPAGLSGISIDPKRLFNVTQETLVAAMGNMAGQRRSVMFSGGFDSMLLALLAKQGGAQITAVTVQFDGFNPLTVTESVKFAHDAGIAHHIIHVKAVEFLSAFEVLSGITDEPLLDLELAIVYAALKNYNSRIAGDVFLSGMGCDQWFGKMALQARPEDFAVRLDWANVNEDAHHRVAQTFGFKFIFPFLSESMLTLSQSIPPAMKEDKKLLRALAVSNTIPYRGARSEEQTPSLIRHILIKMYGDRAWPSPVSVHSKNDSEIDQKLRQIILGLWLEKRMR